MTRYIYITGITRAHCIRITKVDGVPTCHYQENFLDKEGWFPRPAPLIRSRVWDTLFVHPENPARHGLPLTCEAYGVADRGKRQRWVVCMNDYHIYRYHY